MSTAAKISIQIDAQTATLQKGFGEARAAIQKLDSSMSSHVAYGMAKFKVGMMAVRGAIGSVTGAIGAVMRAMDEMGKMDEFASRLGMSADALTVLGYAAEQTGASQDGMNAGLEKMQRLVGEAAAGAKSAVETFAKLGLTVGDIVSLSPEQLFAAIAEKVKATGSAAEKTRIALEIFGKSGGQFINLLNSGKEGLEAFNQEATNMGLLLGNQRSEVEAAGDSINKMKRAWGGFVNQITILVAPALAEVAEGVATVIAGLNELAGNSSGSSAPGFHIVGSTKVLAKKAAREAAAREEWDRTLDGWAKTWLKTAAKFTDKVKDIARPPDWITPGIAAATRGSAAGFSAVQEAQRAKVDAERRQRETVSWLARIYERQREEKITFSMMTL